MTTDRWQDRANCRGLDPNLFFPVRGETAERAKQVCSGCVVRRQCLEYALRQPPCGYGYAQRVGGIWGGTSANERKRMRQTAGLPPAV